MLRNFIRNISFAAFAIFLTGQAHAASIIYTTTAVTSGTYKQGGVETAFTDQPVSISVEADTSKAYGDTSGSGRLFVPFDKVIFDCQGVLRNVILDQEPFLAIFGQNASGGYVNFGKFENGVFLSELVNSGPGLSGYAGVSSLNPIAVVNSVWPYELNLDNGVTAHFSVASDAFFSASAVPEPAAWLTLILGMTIVALVLRRQKKYQAAGLAAGAV